MPRVRAWFLLSLFVVNQAACYSWQTPKVTPQAYVAKHPDKEVRITPKNEQGDLDYVSRVVLSDVRFSGDSVFGRDPDGQPLTFSLQHVALIETYRVWVVPTALAVLVTPVLLAGAIYALVYILGCSTFGASASLGGTSC